jgi:hypothetical protein
MFINGNPHAVTDLWDVGAHRYNLKFTCRGCGHARVFHAAALWWWFEQRRWNGHLSVVPSRIVCGVCWSALRQKVRDPIMEIVDDPDEGDDLPLPPAREWRLAARRRR